MTPSPGVAQADSNTFPVLEHLLGFRISSGRSNICCLFLHLFTLPIAGAMCFNSLAHFSVVVEMQLLSKEVSPLSEASDG